MRFAVRCACCSASELLFMCQQFPHCRVLRRTLHLLRAMRCSPIVSDVFTRCADVSACEEGQQRQQAYCELRSTLRHCSASGVLFM